MDSLTKNVVLISTMSDEQQAQLREERGEAEERERRRKTGREGELREERDKGKGEQTLNSTRGIDEGIPAGHEERAKRGEERRDESKENRTERRQVRGERREKVRRRRSELHGTACEKGQKGGKSCQSRE